MSGIRKTIAVLAGDGIGPEVIGAAIAILRECAASFSHRFEFVEFTPIDDAGDDFSDVELPT